MFYISIWYSGIARKGLPWSLGTLFTYLIKHNLWYNFAVRKKNPIKIITLWLSTYLKLWKFLLIKKSSKIHTQLIIKPILVNIGWTKMYELLLHFFLFFFSKLQIIILSLILKKWGGQLNHFNPAILTKKGFISSWVK